MKLAVAVILFAIYAVQSGAVEEKLAQKLCRTEDDCDWDQCCIEAPTRLPGFNGICHNPTQRGEICNPDPTDKTVEGRYRKACPCDQGLSCLSKEESYDEATLPVYVCRT